jgi:hypothetical protein
LSQSRSRARRAPFLEDFAQRRPAAAPAAEAATEDEISLRQRFSDIHDSLTASNTAHDAILRRHADPAIAEFAAELRALRDASPQLYRLIENDKGKVIGDNKADIDRKLAEFREAIDAVAFEARFRLHSWKSENPNRVCIHRQQSPLHAGA